MGILLSPFFMLNVVCHEEQTGYLSSQVDPVVFAWSCMSPEGINEPGQGHFQNGERLG